MYKLPTEYFSWSQASKYRQCPLLYYYRYVKKLKTPNNIFAVRGSSVHSGIQTGILEKSEKNIAKTCLLEFDTSIKKIEDQWGNVFVDKEELKKFRDLSPLMAETYHNKVGKKIKIKSPEDMEAKVTYDLDGLPMTGWIDIIETKKGCVDILDIKTKDTIPSVPNWGQIILEAIAIQKNNPKVKIRNIRYDYIVPPGKKTPCRVFQFSKKFSSVNPKPICEELKTMAWMISNNIFLPCSSDSWCCNKEWCDFFALCDYGLPRSAECDRKEVK